MRAMPPKTVRALDGASTLFLAGGLLVMSPSGAFFAFCVAAVVVAPAAILGEGKGRLVAVLLLLGAIGLAAAQYPGFKSEQERYRQHSRSS